MRTDVYDAVDIAAKFLDGNQMYYERRDLFINALDWFNNTLIMDAKTLAALAIVGRYSPDIDPNFARDFIFSD